MNSVDSVRLLIPDLNVDDYALTDPQIANLLSLCQNKVFLAAAMALEIIATDEALVYKIVSTDDLSVNGVSGAAQVLLVRAKQLRADQAQADIAEHPEDSFQLVFPTQLNASSGLVPEATPVPWL